MQEVSNGVNNKKEWYKKGKVAAIVVAAGKSERLKTKVRKPFVVLEKEPILAWTLRNIESSDIVDQVILVVHPEDIVRASALIKKAGLKKVNNMVPGGARRIDSVRSGLAGLSGDIDYVIVHDGCRPFVDKKMISSVLEAAYVFGAAIAAVPVKPTIKEVEKGDFVTATLSRELLIEVQTPQAFKRDILIRAYEKAFAEGVDATDDSALVEALGVRVKVVKGSYGNIKITTPEDLKYAKALIEL